MNDVKKASFKEAAIAIENNIEGIHFCCSMLSTPLRKLFTLIFEPSKSEADEWNVISVAWMNSWTPTTDADNIQRLEQRIENNNARILALLFAEVFTSDEENMEAWRLEPEQINDGGY